MNDTRAPTNGFAGFDPEAFAFLGDLKANNDRQWFNARKDQYEVLLKKPMADLCFALADGFELAGLPLRSDPKKSPFRIYRDTRFSNDKSPYKTHVSAYFSRDLTKGAQGGVYLHLEPGRCFVGGAHYHPDPKQLTALRTALVEETSGFEAVVTALSDKGLTLRTDETLSRVPTAFKAHKDHPLAGYLLWKSFITGREFADFAACDPGFADGIIAFAQDCLPLLQWGWRAIDGIDV